MALGKHGPPDRAALKWLVEYAAGKPTEPREMTGPLPLFRRLMEIHQAERAGRNPELGDPAEMGLDAAPGAAHAEYTDTECDPDTYVWRPPHEDRPGFA